jgi:hypothetical protein
MLSNTKSMAPIIIAKIKEATSTKTELLCNSLNLGQVTLFLSSSIESIMNFFNLSNLLYFLLARVERLELPTNGFGDHYSTN